MPKIDISIRRKRPAKTSAANRRGPLDIRREADYLKRRLKPVGTIKFYDMGQKSDGDGGWIQNNYRYDPGLSVAAAVDPVHADDDLIATSPLSLSQVRDFEDSILSGVATADFETTFRQIFKSDGNSFPLSMSNNAGVFDFSSPEWVEEGLRVKQSDLIAPSVGSMQARVLRNNLVVGSDPLIRFLDVTSTTKFTTGSHFSDAAVTFHPKVNDKFFLLPYLAMSRGTSSISTGAHSSEAIYLNHFWHIQPRNFSDPNYIPADIQSHSAGFAEALGYHTGLTGTQTFTVTSTGSGPFNTQRLAVSSGGSFPDGTNGVVSFEPTGSGITSNESQQQWAGQLIGIIKQGTVLYYLWATVDL